MTAEEKNEIVEAVWQRVQERTLPIASLEESDNLSDFSTLPILSKSGELKTCNAERLKGRDFKYEDFTPEQLKAIQDKAVESLRRMSAVYDHGWLTLTL